MIFNHDNDSMPRVWTGKEDIKSITLEARSAVIGKDISLWEIVVITSRWINRCFLLLAGTQCLVNDGCHTLG